MFLNQDGQQAKGKFNLLAGQGQNLSRILIPSFNQNRRYEMISRKISIVFGFVLSLVTLVILAACQPARPIPLAVVAPRIETSLVSADSAEALAYRWQAMADYYEGNGLCLAY